MIISDLNYLEAATEEVTGGTRPRRNDIDFSKNLNANISSRVNLAANFSVNSTFNKTTNINAYANVYGNTSTLTFENEAAGYDTNTQGNFAQLTIAGQGSSQAGYFSSAAV